MAHAMLPNSTLATTRTIADRGPKPASQPVLYGLMPGEEIEDEPGEEMANDARVWKTYVRETDTWDKDMVGGRNSSLDVLLIFAALFSTISTAFIIESLGDLRPNPAESAVQMQRAMLQTQQVLLQAVTAIANGQPFSIPPTQPDPVSAPPTRSAITVNVLWLSSLALSVGVSLIAMLAKDWCYRFLSGRVGPWYEQGRRRQQKWDGIERWKMEEILACLPGAMHLALLLFAVGLSIYLWDIHIAVALPVTMVTGVVVCGYLAATALPLLQRFCPYSTPVTPVLNWLMNDLLLKAIEYVRERSSRSPDLRSRSTLLWGGLCTWIPRHWNLGHASSASHEVQMDGTTGRMLAWLITMCDDPRSVDVALQAISGAGSSLPCSPLFRSRANEQLLSRMSAYRQQSFKPGGLDAGNASAVMRFVRSYAALYTDDLEAYLRTPEAQAVKLRESLVGGLFDTVALHRRVHDKLSWMTGHGDKLVLLAAASGSMMISRSMRLGFHRQNHEQFFGYDHHTTEPIICALKSHGQSKIVLDSATVRYLLRSLSYHIAAHDLTYCRSLGGLYGSLARLCVASHPADTELSRMACVVLTAAAFMLRSYPSSEALSLHDHSARSKRALQVVEYYQSHEPDYNTATGLFAFGFVAVLPYLPLGVFDSFGDRNKVLPLLFSGLSQLSNWADVYSFPSNCSLDSHLGLSVEPLTHVQATLAEPADIRTWSDILRNECRLDMSDPQLCIPALKTLCRTGFAPLQELCASILDSQKALFEIRQVLDNVPYLIYWAVEGLLVRGTDVSMASALIFYVRLLVARIMLSPTVLQSSREMTATKLQTLWNYHDTRVRLESGGSMPTSDTILQHLAEDTDHMDQLDCVRATAQLIVDFCSTSNPDANPRPAYPDWETRLHEIRCSRCPAVCTANWSSAPVLAGIVDTPSDITTLHAGSFIGNLRAKHDEGQREGSSQQMLLTVDGTAWD